MNNVELVIIFISIITGTAYFILIISFTLGWIKLKKFAIYESPSTFISIVVPVRNEQDHIDSLIESLLRQNYPATLYEIIIINDHSTDNTFGELKKHEGLDTVTLLELVGEQGGKKSAIDLGVRQASGILIASLDADCIPAGNWLKTISSCYEQGRYKMIAGPVTIHKPKTWLSSFQALELLSLVASGGGAIGIKKPIMCNGANLIYEKEAYLKVDGFKGNEHIPGGDDIFLMEKIKKAYPKGSIGFNTNPQGLVYTAASENLMEFLNQRMRWVAKSPAYRNPFLITSALVVLLFNLIMLITLISSICSMKIFLAFCTLFFLKCIIDFPILWMASSFSKQRQLMVFYLPFQLIYFIFISMSGVMGNLLSSSWKGRK